jgi:hypothetical protein
VNLLIRAGNAARPMRCCLTLHPDAPARPTAHRPWPRPPLPASRPESSRDEWNAE